LKTKSLVLGLFLILLGLPIASILGQPLIEGAVDVHNDPPLSWVSTYGSENPWNLYRWNLYNSSNVRNSTAFAQPFTPTLPILTAVDIALAVWTPYGAYCRVEIMDNATGRTLAFNEQHLTSVNTENNKSYYHFSFSPPADVSPGRQYLILLYGTNSYHAYGFVAVITEKTWKGPYLLARLPNGTLRPYELPEAALAFRTYGLERLPVTTTTTETQPRGVEYSTWFLVAVAVAALLVLGVSLARRRHRYLSSPQ
jgi:hypothetical protein